MSKLMDGPTNEHTNDRMSQRYWSLAEQDVYRSKTF